MLVLRDEKRRYAMKNAVAKSIGSLKSLSIDGTPGGPCVVFFHGYGADAADLIPLYDMLHLSSNTTFICPEAQMEVIIAPGMYGKAWFQIDSRRLEEAMKNGEPTDMSQTTPPGLEQARKVAARMYDELVEKHSKVIIGGFSQGAMLATELALTHAKKPSGLVLMSATLLNEERWKKLAPSCDGVPFFQCHGKNDALLGYDYAERLFTLLNDAGLHGDFFSFSGGHEIPPKAIERIAKFIKSN